MLYETKETKLPNSCTSSRLLTPVLFLLLLLARATTVVPLLSSPTLLLPENCSEDTVSDSQKEKSTIKYLNTVRKRALML